jgi:hypothetical protein
MNLLLWGLALGTVGKLILGIAVLRVHMHILREHRIDGIVLAVLKREQYVTLFGLALIIIGFALEVMFYGDYTNLLTCFDGQCAGPVFESITR